MAKFTVGQDPVKGLTELKAYMEEQISKIKKQPQTRTSINCS